MPIASLDDWIDKRAQSLPLSTLADTAVGVDASHYLKQHLVNLSTKEPLEPLVPAHGGLPILLRANIEKQLDVFLAAKITPIFVFDGLDFPQRSTQSGANTESSRLFDTAWDLYNRNEGGQAVATFSVAGSPIPDHYYRLLQEILHEKNIDFMVAPYAASAQLVYLLDGEEQFIDSIYGFSDLILFDADKIITHIDTNSEEAPYFTWISKDQCQGELGPLTKDQFFGFCLLLGSQFSRPFAPFESFQVPGQLINMRDALNLYATAGRNPLALCHQYDDVYYLQGTTTTFVDAYERSCVTVKHHVILDKDGKIRPLDPANIPNDLHDLISQRLPDELYYYISKGVIATAIPNGLSSGNLKVHAPYGANEPELYRSLVTNKLTPIRSTSLSILSSTLHRYFQMKTVTTHSWLDDDKDKDKQTINLKEISAPKSILSSWKVNSDQCPAIVKDAKVNRLLSPCLQALTDAEFVGRSFTMSKEPLNTKHELLSNVIWRFLHIRGYVDDKHNLTKWGHALQKALSNVAPDDDLAESVFLGVEALRMGLMDELESSSDPSPNAKVSEEDKNMANLISRTATVGSIKHKPVAYSGPLSRYILRFHHKITVLCATLRELLEVLLTNVLLYGDFNRNQEDLDLFQLSLDLPLNIDNNCVLGVAVRAYLNDASSSQEHGSSTRSSQDSEESSVKSTESCWFPHVKSLKDNVQTAFKIWDSIYIASQNSDGEFRAAKQFEDANVWLQKRR